MEGNAIMDEPQRRVSLRRLGPALVAYAAAWTAMLLGAATTVLLVEIIPRVPEGWFVIARPYYIGLAVQIVAGLLFAHVLRRRPPTLPLRAGNMPARSAVLTALWGALLGLVIAGVFSRRDTGDRFPFGPDPLPGGDVIAFFASALVFYPAAALMEELLFRGTIQPRLQAVFGARAAFIVTAVAFALCHAETEPVIILIAALGMGWLAMRDGALWRAFWFHLGFNEALHVGRWAWSSRGVSEVALAAMLALVLAVLHVGGARASQRVAAAGPD